MKGTRIIQGLALGGALLAVTWLVVVPAFGSSVGSKVPPPSVSGVLPTDYYANDTPNDCGKLFYPSGGAPTYAFRIKDGTSKKYTDPATGATFTLTVNPPNSGYPSGSGSAKWPAYANGTYFSFTSTGAAIVDVGVDGDNEKDATRYSYSGAAGGSVSGDGYLHASALKTNSDGSPKTLDGLDDMSFCYNKPAATVSGSVYRDANQDKTNNDSSPLAGWTVNLYAGGTLSQHTTSSSTGAYSFSVPAGSATYTVCEVPPTGGWSQTQAGTATCSGTGELSSGYAVTAPTGGATYSGRDFGNVQLVSISGTAFTDVSGNGVQDAGDGGLTALTATLTDNTKGTSTTTTTGADGSFTFGSSNVAGNSFTVCIQAPSGTNKQTAPGSGGGCSGAGQAANANKFTLAAAGDTTSLFGFQPIGSIAGMLYNDVNQNGTYDSGDTTQPGWTVDLYAGSGTSPVQTTTSDSSGNYSFSLPLTAAGYTVCEAPPAASGDWAQSEPDPSSMNHCLNGTDLPKGYVLTPGGEGASITGNDFGNVPAHSASTGTITTPDNTYQANLGSPKDVNVVINDGTTSDGKPYVSLWSGDSTGTKVPILEKITFPNGLNDDGTFKYTQVEYTDGFPFVPADAKPMPACKVDPRDPADPDSLTTEFKNPSTEDQVLPAGATSCLIVESPYADPDGHAFARRVRLLGRRRLQDDRLVEEASPRSCARRSVSRSSSSRAASPPASSARARRTSSCS